MTPFCLSEHGNNNMAWSTLSNAFEKSRYIMSTVVSVLKMCIRSSTTKAKRQ